VAAPSLKLAKVVCTRNGDTAGPTAASYTVRGRTNRYLSPSGNSHLFNTHRYQLTDASYIVSQHNWLRRCPPPPDVTAQSCFSGIKRRTGMVRTPLVFSAYDVKLEA
jgi:hypothetical protein